MMKNSLLSLTMMLFCLAVSAQNVGIGEPNPAEKLDVNGRIAAKGFKYSIYNSGGLSSGSVSMTNQPDWQDIPDLSITFSLDATTTVMSNYSFTGFYPSQGYFLIRLLIDGVETDRSIVSVENIRFFTLNGHYISEMSSGDHTIKIQYKTPGISFTHNPAGDGISNRFLQVLVYGSN